MKQIILGQVLLILCCVVYLVWWTRGYRPGVAVNRLGGVNGILLAVTALLGIAGILFSLLPVPALQKPIISQSAILIGGIVLYVVLLIVTKGIFTGS